MSEEKLKELVERSIYVKKYFHKTGGNGTPVMNVISGEEFQQWIADIRAIVVRFKSDSFTESIIDLTNRFNGWTDETDFEKLVSSLNTLYKEQDYYINNKTTVINSNKDKLNRRRISEWASEMLPLVNDSSTKEALEKIGTVFQNIFDVQWTKGRPNTSVHLYEISKTDIVYGHLKIENGSIRSVGPNGLKGKNVKAHKCIEKLKELVKVDSSNIDRFIEILTKALTQTNDIEYIESPDDEDENDIDIENPDDENESNISQNQQSIAGYINDSDFDSNDKLEIETDVIAFASLIAYKYVNPPLAIALFGKWGSGKSFFLEKLQKRIESLSRIKSQSVYCKNIVHVKFNAWHYSDTNLWANLITQIFDMLYQHVSEDPSPKKETLELLYEELESTKALLAEEKEKLQKLNNSKTQLSTELAKSNKELNDKNSKINQLSTINFVTIAFGTEEVKQSIKEIEDLIGDESINNIQDVYIITSQLKSAMNRFFKAIKTLEKQTGKKFLASIFACILAPIIIYYLVKLSGSNPFVKNISTLLATVVSFLTPVFIYVKPMLNKLKAGHERLVNLQEQISKIRESKRQLVTEQVSLLQKEIHSIELTKTEINKESFKLDQKISSIEREIKDIVSGKMLLTFLEEKTRSGSYKRHLGILASIRKDFETLDEILRNQDSVVSEKGIRVDRIVLYIDDLDRCPKEKVVEVLEAIHLLLAFPLFVVIVGVDQRWISSALELTYGDLLCSSLETTVGLQQEGTNQHEIFRVEGATPYDYLEKIFQISFALKPLNRDSINNYIEMSCIDSISKDQLTNDEDKSDLSFEVQSVGNIHSYEEANSGGTVSGDSFTYINPEKLELNREEIEFMKKISLLIGDTPRTIKRFINTYRIVRCHGGLRLSENRMEDYKVAMTLLATLFKDIKLFQELLEVLKNNPTRTFGALIEESELPLDLKTILGQLEEVKDVKANTFERNVSLVARFAFRPIAV